MVTLFHAMAVPFPFKVTEGEEVNREDTRRTLTVDLMRNKMLTQHPNGIM